MRARQALPRVEEADGRARHRRQCAARAFDHRDGATRHRGRHLLAHHVGHAAEVVVEVFAEHAALLQQHLDPADVVVEQRRAVGVEGVAQGREMADRVLARLAAAARSVARPHCRMAAELARDHRVGQGAGLIAQLVTSRQDERVGHQRLDRGGS
jgi:hypothetical protein